MILEPPTRKPPCVVAGNYEPNGENDEIICPCCDRHSGWSIILWLRNIPPQGLYCNSCGNNFTQEDIGDS